MRENCAVRPPVGRYIACAVQPRCNGCSSDQNNGKDYAGRPIENPTVPQASIPRPAQEQTVEQNVQDIHFAFDRSDITPEQQAVLQADAQWLKTHPNSIITLEGHADDREESCTISHFPTHA